MNYTLDKGKDKPLHIIPELFILLFVISMMFSGCSMVKTENTAYPKAIDGMIDLSSIDLNKNDPIKLDGEWEFYWDRLLQPEDFQNDHQQMTGYINVPQSWNGYIVNSEKLDGYGYATYRLRVKVQNRTEMYGLKMLPMGTAYKLWVNGELLSSNGKVGSTDKETAAQYLTKEVLFTSQQPYVELVLQISNFQHQKGGFWYSVEIGSAQQAEKSALFKLLFDMFLIGALFIIGLYHLVFYIQKERAFSALLRFLLP